MTYIVTIYIAAPGTPLAEDGGYSTPGHMYYSISDGRSSKSYGFAPIEHGQLKGEGMVYKNDVSNYSNPMYSRTLEVTEQQYKALESFGEQPQKSGFDTYYRDVRNNCVDFTWGALNKAGLHATLPLPGNQYAPRTAFEGDLKPVHNVDEVKTIQPPFPNSPLNKEHTNLRPPIHNLKQWLTGQVEQEQGETMRYLANDRNSSTQTANNKVNNMFDNIMSAHLLGDDRALKQAQTTAFNSDLAQNSFNEVRQQNVAAENQFSERQAELEHQQTIAMTTPAKTMKM